MVKRGSLRWVGTLAVFVAAWALLFATMNRELNLFDEGLVLVDAVRTLRGEVIHRDFYAIYGPATSWILAALFRFDPHWFLLARGFGTAAMAGCVVGTYAILGPRVRLSLALTTTAAAFVWAITSKAYLYPVFPCGAAMFAGAALLLRRHEGGGRANLIGAGACIGLAALFRYDLGGFIALGGLSFVLWSARERGTAICHEAALFLAGIASICLPPAVHYLAVAPWQAFYADVIDYGLHHYAANRGLPFPPLRPTPHGLADAAVYLPVVALLAGAWGLLSQSRHRPAIVLFAILTAVCFVKGFVRVSILHMIPALLPAGVVLAFVLDAAVAERRYRALPLALAGTFALPLLATVAVSAYAALLEKRNLNPDRATADTCPPPPLYSGAHVPRFYWPALHFLRAQTRPGESVLVALPRHDRIYINSIGLNFLLARPPATRWAQMDSGMQTRADIQKAMVGELARTHTRWIVRDASFEGAHEPNASEHSSGVFVLDRYIAENYRPVVRFGAVELWLIGSEPTPQQKPARCR